MKEIGDLEEGWLCGAGHRCNDMFYRTQDKKEADIFDLGNAIAFWQEYNNLGYPCKIKPKVSKKELIEILSYDKEEN